MKISGTTRLIGIIGYPITHSFSTIIHNHAFRLTGLDLCYVPFEVRREDTGQAVKGLAALGVLGVNVTVPHKESVIPFIDSLDESARTAGAVNTIIFRDGTTRGMNTDVDGFINAWDEDVREPHEGAHVAIIGTGGSARAVYHALCRRKVKRITLLSRKRERAEALHSHFSSVHRSVEREISIISEDRSVVGDFSDCAAIVNCTPLGMVKYQHQVPLRLPAGLSRSCVLFDLVYNPLETQFMKDGKALGLRVFNGLGMLLHQGAMSFREWTSREFPMNDVRQHLQGYLSEYFQEKTDKERKEMK
jgi:shikimate dehydrogenase